MKNLKCPYACQTVDHTVSRRAFLGGSLLGLGGLAGLGHLTQPAIAESLVQNQKQVLLIWLHGGVSQLETWDPKPKTDTGGPFRAIPTSVPGVHISELLPECAKRMHMMTLIRGLDTGENDHNRGQYLMHTGRRLTPGQDYPVLGSVAAWALDEASNPLPGSIHIRPGGGGSSSADAAFLGPRYGTLILGNGRPPADIDLPKGIDLDADDRRYRMLARLNDRFAQSRRSAMTDAYMASYDQARLLMERKSVFDVSLEPEAEQERYGSHDFGRHCLLARRLLEAGVPFVKVAHSNYDTHNENFNFHIEQLHEFERPYCNLLDDLKASGRLEHTLVIVMSEFGRTPKINHLYGRDHWSRAWSIAVAGAGVTHGHVFGATNKNGTEVTDGKVGGAELFHTFLTALDIDPTMPHFINGRDIQLADPAAHAIHEILA